MNLLELKYFMDAAKYQNFSRAANYNHVPPSSISKAVKNLENKYGTSLFDRSGRNIYLNEKGKFLYEQACSIFATLDECNHHFAQVCPNQIVIYVQDIAFLPPLLATDFMYEHPDTYITFTPVEEVLHATRTPYDFTFMHIWEDMKPYNYQKIMQDDMVLLVSKDHPLAVYDEIDAYDIRHERFAGFWNTMTLRMLADRICREIGQFNAWHIFETHDELSLIYFVASGRAIALFPEKLYNVYPNPNIKVVRLKETMANETAIAWVKGKKLSRAEEDFLDYTLEWFRKKWG